jgi:hypothetical protein
MAHAVPVSAETKAEAGLHHVVGERGLGMPSPTPTLAALSGRISIKDGRMPASPGRLGGLRQMGRDRKCRELLSFSGCREDSCWFPKFCNLTVYLLSNHSTTICCFCLGAGFPWSRCCYGKPVVFWNRLPSLEAFLVRPFSRIAQCKQLLSWQHHLISV